MDNIRKLPIESQRKLWLRECPYAALFLISCVGEVSQSRLTQFVNGYTALDASVSRELVGKIIRVLQRDGNIFEAKQNRYSSFPPYAIQKNQEEWLILGDARVDTFIAKGAPVFQVIRTEGSCEEIHFERLLMIENQDAHKFFSDNQIRPFQRIELVNLIQDVDRLIKPISWSEYEPNPCDRWEILSDSGYWTLAKSQSAITEELCRSINVDREGNTIIEKYYFRNKDGWSPLIIDEARLWIYRIMAEADKPYEGKYSNVNNTFQVPLGLPYTAYVALRYLGSKTKIIGNHLFVENIDFDVVKDICGRLHIKLEVDSGKT